LIASNNVDPLQEETKMFMTTFLFMSFHPSMTIVQLYFTKMTLKTQGHSWHSMPLLVKMLFVTILFELSCIIYSNYCNKVDHVTPC
jgi:putative effector of murein hydrolase